MMSAVLLCCGRQSLSASVIDRQAVIREVHLQCQAGEYRAAHDMLLRMLERRDLSRDDRVFLLLTLSRTHKWLFDYPAVLRYLSEAETVARNGKAHDSVVAVIMAERAFALFDIEQFERSDSVRKLVNLDYIGPYGSALLTIQAGHYAFKRRNYDSAASHYEVAEGLMREDSPCDLPLVHVKQMQLFDAQGQRAKRDSALQLALHNAEQCRMVRYSLLVMEQYVRILTANKEQELLHVYDRMQDSVRAVFDAEEHAMALNLQREQREIGSREEQLAATRRERMLLASGVVALLLVLGTGVAYSVRQHRIRKEREEEFASMKEQLKRYLENVESGTDTMAENEAELQSKTLSARQREVLDLLKLGKSNREIAETLFVSENTVKFHIKGIYNVLGIKDRKQLKGMG